MVLAGGPDPGVTLHVVSTDRGRHADPLSARETPWARRTRPKLGVIGSAALLYFWIPLWACAGGVGLLTPGHPWWLEAIGASLIVLGLAGLTLLAAYLRRPTARS